MKSMFFEKDYIVAIVLALAVQACYQSPQAGSTLATDSGACATLSCSSSTQCGVGEVCGADGCCQPWIPEAGACDELDPTCMTSTKLCEANSGGCECQILDVFGATSAANDATLVVTPYQSVPVVAQLSLVGANPIVDTDFLVSSSDPSCADIIGNTVTTHNRSCETTITVEFGKLATCTARIVGLGAATNTDAALLYILDEESRQPVPADAIVIDTDGDGVRDIPAYVTEQPGVYTVDVQDATEATISVFAPGYHYITLANVKISPAAQLYVPVSELSTATTVGGASGKIDLDEHRNTFLAGESRSIQLAMVSSALNLKSLPSFDLETLLGGSPASLNCEENPNAAGCYEIGIPGVYEASLPVWGGLVFSFQGELMKPHFEIQTQPGRPYLWGIGGEWKLDEVESVARAFLVDESCTASGEPNPECIRRTTRSLLKNLSPLMAKASLGVRGNVGLEGRDSESWYDYISQPYGPHRLEEESYPVLDPSLGEHQGLNLNQPLNHYTNIVLPELPTTPSGQRVDTVVAMTGVSSRTGGFVPLGLTAGFDCATPDCSDEIGTSGDGVIDSQELCNPDDDTSGDLCRPNVPTTQPAGTVGMFHASPTEYLMGEPIRTVVLAMQLDGLQPSTVSGILLDGNLPPDSLSLEGTEFMAFEPVDLRADQRLVRLNEQDSEAVSQVVIEQADSNLTWTVIADSNTTEVVLPTPPADSADPVSNVDGIVSTKLKLRPMRSVQDKLENFVSGLDRLFDDVLAFSAARQ